MADSDSDPDPPATASETPPTTEEVIDPTPSTSSDPDPVSSSSSEPFESQIPSPLSSPSSATSHWIPRTSHVAFFQSLTVDVISYHCSKIHKLFHDYEVKSIMTPEFELSVIPLIKHVPASLEAFKNLLPIGKFVRSPSTKKGTTVFTRQPCLNDKIRTELYHDIENYLLWLKHLTDYKNGAESLSDFRRNVEVYFANMPANLRAEFDAKYPPDGPSEMPSSTSGHIAESFQESSSGAGAAPSDCTEQGSASKRRKTL